MSWPDRVRSGDGQLGREGAVLAVNEWALSTNPNARRGRFMSSSKSKPGHLSQRVNLEYKAEREKGRLEQSIVFKTNDFAPGK